MALALFLASAVALARRRLAPSSAGERPDWRYGIARLRDIISPPVEVTSPPSGVHFERDVEVAVSDGTILRVNVFRPERDGRYPVIMCAHPYGRTSYQGVATLATGHDPSTACFVNRSR